MNISFYDGINDGKFFNINAGKYDDLDDIDDINVDDIDISEEECNLHDGLPCEDCECPGLKELKEKITELEGNDFGDFEHMEKIDKELSTHLTMINKVNMRLNQLGNKISDLKEFRDETYELQYGQLLDRLNLIEKKIDAFKCIDILDKVSHLYERLEKVETKLEKLERGLTSNGMLIADFGRHINNTDCELSSLSDRVSNLDSKLEKLDIDVTSNMDKANDRMGIIEKKLTMFYDILDRVMKLEEQVKPTVLEEAEELEVRPSVLDDILDRLGKLEEDSVSAQQSIASVVTKDIRDDVRLHHIDNKLKELEEQVKPIVQHDILERRWKGYHWVPFDYKFGAKTETIEDFEKRIGISRKRTESSFEFNKNDIQDDSVNHPSHYTDGKYETIDFIEEYGMKTHIGNAIKYASRAGKKDEDTYIEDLKKGLWYLHRYNCPPKKKHIDVFDYCKEKKLPIELTNVLIAISRENYTEAERVLRNYIEELKK